MPRVRFALAIVLALCSTSDLTAQPTAPITDVTGSVTDASSKAPIAGARVRLFSGARQVVADLAASIEPFAELTTDAAGKFHFVGTPLDPHLTIYGVCEADGYIPFHLGPVFPGTTRSCWALLTRGRPITLTFVGASGARIPRGTAGILHRSSEGAGTPSGTMREVLLPFRDSTLTTFVADEGWSVTAWAPGCARTSLPASGIEAANGVIRLEPGRSITGRVQDNAGRPVAGAEIGTVGAQWRSLIHARTDAEGRFRISTLGPESANARRLTAFHPDYRVTSPVEAKAGDDITITVTRAAWLELDLELSPGGPLESLGARGEPCGIEWLSAPPLDIEPTPAGGVPNLHVSAQPHLALFREGPRYRSEPFAPGAGRGRVQISGYLPLELEWDERAGAIELGRRTLLPGSLLVFGVVDANGAPVENASAVVRPLDLDERYRRTIASGQSDARGEGRLSGLKVESYHLSVFASGFRSHEQSITIPKDGESPPLSIQLFRGGKITARIIGAQGQPIAGVTGSIAEPIGEKGTTSQSGESGADGALVVEQIRTGERVELVLTVTERVGRTLVVEPLSEGEVRELGDIVLSSGGTLRGVVRDDAGQPVPGVRVQVESTAARGDRALARRQEFAARTAADGSYVVRGLSAGEYRVVIQTDGYNDPSYPAGVRGPLERSVSVAGDGETVLDLTLKRMRVEKLRVLDTLGRPVGGVSVNVTVCVGAGSNAGDTSDENGVLDLPAIPHGPVRLNVSRMRPDNYQETLCAESFAAVPREIIVPALATLRVRVSSATAPDPRFGEDLYVYFADDPWEIACCHGLAPAARIVDGLAVFSDLLPGRHTLIARAQRLGRSEPFEVSLDAEVLADVDVTLKPFAVHRVQLVVRGSNGEPAAGAQARGPGGKELTADDGGRVELTIEEGRGRRIDVTYADHVDFSRTLSEDELSASPCVIQLRRLATLVVMVTDAEGAPVEGASVDYYPRNSSSNQPAHTDAEGRTVFDVVPGRGSLRVQGNDETLGNAQIEIGAGERREVACVASAPVMFAGTVRRNGAPVAGLEVSARNSMIGNQARATTGADGRYSLAINGPGPYYFHVGRPAADGHFDTLRSWMVEQEPSNAVDVDIAQHRVEVRVTDAVQRPLACQLVSLWPSGFRPPPRYTDTGGRAIFEEVGGGPCTIEIANESDLAWGDRDLTVADDCIVEMAAVKRRPCRLRLSEGMSASRHLAAENIGPGPYIEEHVPYRRIGAAEIEIYVPPGEQWLFLSSFHPAGDRYAYVVLRELEPPPEQIDWRHGAWIWGKVGDEMSDKHVFRGLEVTIEPLDGSPAPPLPPKVLTRLFGYFTIGLPIGRYRMSCVDQQGVAYAADMDTSTEVGETERGATTLRARRN